MQHGTKNGSEKNQRSTNVLRPKNQAGEVGQHVVVYADEQVGENTSEVDVRRMPVRLKARVVAEDLRDAGRGHRGDEEGVAEDLNPGKSKRATVTVGHRARARRDM